MTPRFLNCSFNKRNFARIYGLGPSAKAVSSLLLGSLLAGNIGASKVNGVHVLKSQHAAVIGRVNDRLGECQMAAIVRALADGPTSSGDAS